MEFKDRKSTLDTDCKDIYLNMRHLKQMLKEYEEAQRHDNAPQNVTLRRGDKGEYVKQLQQKLKEHLHKRKMVEQFQEKMRIHMKALIIKMIV